jgi:5-methylcytosine-specific restriction endonuclease McrA
MAGTKRSKEHINVQKQVKEKDGYECEICGVIASNAHGHHIIPYKDNGPAELINMMTLCPDCHRGYHSGKIKVDIWRF